jgi:hypothetical protein
MLLHRPFPSSRLPVAEESVSKQRGKVEEEASQRMRLVEGGESGNRRRRRLKGDGRLAGKKTRRELMHRRGEGIE